MPQRAVDGAVVDIEPMRTSSDHACSETVMRRRPFALSRKFFIRVVLTIYVVAILAANLAGTSLHRPAFAGSTDHRRHARRPRLRSTDTGRPNFALLLCQASPESATDEMVNAHDWRTFRARLIARSEANQLLERKGEAIGAEEDGATKPQGDGKGWLHTTPLIEKGSVLLSVPGASFIHCPHFHKAVVIITDHHEEFGSMGFILNRPTARVVRRGNVEFNVWYGGPCQSLEDPPEEQWSYCLHTRGDLSKEKPIIEGVFMMQPWEAYNHVVNGRASPDEFMFITGHSGWAPGQLQGELDGGDSWQMTAVDSGLLVGSLARRQRALAKMHRFQYLELLPTFGMGLSMWRRLFRRVEGGLPEVGMLDRHADSALRQWLRVLDSEAEGEEEDFDEVFGSFPMSPEDIAESLSDLYTDREEDAQEDDGPNIKSLVYQILQVMGSKRDVPFALEQGCEALRSLITDDDSRDLVASNNGIQAVLEAMDMYPDDPGVQGHCSGTLTHLAAGSAARRIIFSLDGVHRVLQGMGRHTVSSLVQYKGCAFLANLATETWEQEEVASAGAIPMVLRAMEAHLGELEVQDYCFGALYNLAQQPEHCTSINALGGASLVERAMQAHASATIVQRTGPKLLDILQPK
mmetsp:Transcript_156479/g.502112  ORF Transcript_156479/g.502112 Transcript_156479/m.502112 type:complete len:634 (-) Transcript_156479:14-1915(-)